MHLELSSCFQFTLRPPPEPVKWSIAGVEMDEFTGTAALIADDRRPGVDPIEPAQAVAPQDGVRRRRCEARLPGQHVGPDPQPTPPEAQGGHDDRAVASGRTTRRA